MICVSCGVKLIKNILIVLIIIVLSSCSANKMKSGLIKGLYSKTHPNTSLFEDQIKLGYTEKECDSIEKWCNKTRFHEQGSIQENNYYCTCFY